MAEDVPAVGGDKEHDDQCEAETTNMPIMLSLCGCWARANVAPSPSVPPAATDETPTVEYVPSDLLNEMFDAIAKSNPKLWYRAAEAIRSVPAATDDEAALAVMTEALHNKMCKCLYWDDGIHRNFYRDAVVAVVAALHAHGYRRTGR